MVIVPDISPPLDTRAYDGQRTNQGGVFIRAHGQSNAEICKKGAPSLTCNHEAPIIIQDASVMDKAQSGLGVSRKDTAYTLDHGIAHSMTVRRLTPRECERLQGFPDDYTKIPYRGKKIEQCPDGPRYKALGNAMAVPVVRWIGKRIVDYENLNGRRSDGHGKRQASTNS